MVSSTSEKRYPLETMPRWTEQSRKKQSELIKQVKPWKRSTGPKTRQGKRRSSQNALRTGEHTELVRTLRQINAIYRKIPLLNLGQEDLTL